MLTPLIKRKAIRYKSYIFQDLQSPEMYNILNWIAVESTYGPVRDKIEHRVFYCVLSSVFRSQLMLIERIKGVN